MKKLLLVFGFLTILALIFGCDKQRTITSTEYVKEIEYLPGTVDTVLMLDTILQIDTVIVYDTTKSGGGTDTLFIIDTVTNETVDTLIITETVTDTITVTIDHYDTVTVNHYDTVTVHDVDTVTISQCDPFVQFAFAAMEYYGNAEILNFINGEFGFTDGWIYYLSIGQCDLQSPSPGVYEIYGYANYWTVEFDGYYPLEFFWQLSYLGDDPSDPDNWELSDPPARSSGKTGGIQLTIDRTANVVGSSVQIK